MTSSSVLRCFLLAVCAQASELKLFEAVEPHMGTLVRIKLYAAGEDEAAGAFRAAFARIAELDAALSDYKPDSELNRAARDGVGAPVRVSDDLFRVLEASQKLAAETGGAFDVTLGPVIRLWREARKNGHPPAAEALAEARGRTGYAKLHLDPVRHTVMLDQAGMQLDLGAIGKGYAADEALAVLAKLGIRTRTGRHERRSGFRRSAARTGAAGRSGSRRRRWSWRMPRFPRRAMPSSIWMRAGNATRTSSIRQRAPG